MCVVCTLYVVYVLCCMYIVYLCVVYISCVVLCKLNVFAALYVVVYMLRGLGCFIVLCVCV